ncbi:head-tail adaptor protein [Paracoccus sp. R86501]|uniref:head-tail adaptor protein n=1 Tax=Paracoccus sp. R86501 TaxID=3101711 RepID=UPI003672DA2B
MAEPNLTTQLALEQPDRVADGLGGYATTWRRLGLLWAQMDASSGREDGAISAVRWRITVRAAPVGDTRRPKAGQRFRMGDRLFLIEAVAERDPLGAFLTCHAREENPT